MTKIVANYGGMAAAVDGMMRSWQRIEELLVQCDAAVAPTRTMKAESLTAYLLLKARWDAGAGERQQALRELAAVLDGAATAYREVDQRAAALFLG